MTPKPDLSKATPEEILELTDADISAGSQALALNLTRTEKGMAHANLDNCVRILERDIPLVGLVWFDEFLGRILTQHRTIGGSPDSAPHEWSRAHDLNLTCYIQAHIRIHTIAPHHVSAAVEAVARRRTRNCVKDWLAGLQWDQIPRCETMMEDHFGVQPSAYARAASLNFWVSMIARVYRPGCKVDNMLILEGKQGVGKSRALEAIGGDWFSTQHESASNAKAFAEILEGKLLIEIDEMHSFSRSEVTRVKAAVSNGIDRYRGAYDPRATDHARTSVFVGTTNADDWHTDETGARRFWPMACMGRVDVDAIFKLREQYFAEALSRYLAGATWYGMPETETETEQRARYRDDVWAEGVDRYLGQEKISDRWADRLTPLVSVSVPEILEALGLKTENFTHAHQMRIAAVLKHRGWIRRRQADRSWRYIREVMSTV